MKSARIGRHPVHPALVHFPIAAWSAVPVLDGLALAGAGAWWWRCAFWLIVVSLVLALPAMAAGFWDLLALGPHHPAQATAQRHGLLMGTAWSLFVADLLLQGRTRAPTSLLEGAGLLLALIGLAVMVVGAYAGGQLVYDWGLGQTRTHDD